jgi:hypothetical protein
MDDGKTTIDKQNLDHRRQMVGYGKPTQGEGIANIVAGFNFV